MRPTLVGLAALFALLAVSSAESDHTIPAHDNPVVDTTYSFAFDVPRGIIVEHAPNTPEYFIGRADSGLFMLECGSLPDARAFMARLKWAPPSRLPALPDLRDSLLVDAELSRCDAAGPGEDFSADSVLQLRRYRTHAGLSVLELTYRVHDRTYPEELDSQDPFQSDTSYSAGPSFIVDLGRGRLLRLAPGDCRWRMSPTTLSIADRIVRSIRPAASSHGSRP